MQNKKVFCYECRNDVNYAVINATLETIIDDKSYTYSGQIAYCKTCGAEIYVPEIHDTNLQSFNEVYDKQHDLPASQLFNPANINE